MKLDPPVAALTACLFCPLRCEHIVSIYHIIAIADLLNDVTMFAPFTPYAAVANVGWPPSTFDALLFTFRDRCCGTVWKKRDLHLLPGRSCSGKRLPRGKYGLD